MGWGGGVEVPEVHLLQHGGAALRGGAAGEHGEHGALGHVPDERGADRLLELLVRVLHLRAVDVVEAAHVHHIVTADPTSTSAMLVSD